MEIIEKEKKRIYGQNDQNYKYKLEQSQSYAQLKLLKEHPE